MGCYQFQWVNSCQTGMSRWGGMIIYVRKLYWILNENWIISLLLFYLMKKKWRLVCCSLAGFCFLIPKGFLKFICSCLCRVFRKSSLPPSCTANLQISTYAGDSHRCVHMIMVQQMNLGVGQNAVCTPALLCSEPWTSLHLCFLRDKWWTVTLNATELSTQHEPPREGLRYSPCFINLHFLFPKCT